MNKKHICFLCITFIIIIIVAILLTSKKTEAFSGIYRGPIPSNNGKIQLKSAYGQTEGTVVSIPSGDISYPNGRDYDPQRDVNIVGVNIPPPYDELVYPASTAPVDFGDPSILVSPPEKPIAELKIQQDLAHPYPAFNEQSYVKTYPRMLHQENYNPTVVGCGARNEPCDGGSQHIIPNWMPPLSISNENIAPVNISPDNPYFFGPQQVGVLFKINGVQNEWYPLYGERIDGRRWMYYTVVGPNKVKMLVYGPRKGEELGMNDSVRIGKLTGFYRVSKSERDVPIYVR